MHFSCLVHTNNNIPVSSSVRRKFLVARWSFLVAFRSKIITDSPGMPWPLSTCKVKQEMQGQTGNAMRTVNIWRRWSHSERQLLLNLTFINPNPILYHINMYYGKFLALLQIKFFHLIFFLKAKCKVNNYLKGKAEAGIMLRHLQVARLGQHFARWQSQSPLIIWTPEIKI